MNNLKNTIIISGLLLLLFSCNKNANDGTETQTGNNGQANTVTVPNSSSNGAEIAIGTQTWATANLNVGNFKNGDAIPEAKTAKEWEQAGKDKKPAWCYYDNKPENGATYGRLYNWYAVHDSRGLAPEGWRVPSDTDWTVLTTFLGGAETAGLKMKTTSGWKKNNNGDNSSGFSALPGGYRYFFGPFYSLGKGCYWWSSTENFSDDAFPRYISHDYINVYRFGYYKQNGLSVRCLKN